MAFLATALPYIALGASAIKGVAEKNAGEAADINAQSIALQQERQGIAAQEEAQREAQFERKRSEYLMSRAKAVAAASGGSASDPTIANIIGDIKGEGEYRALAALYSGDSDAELAKAQAAATRRTGRAQRRAANLSASSTILGGLTSFYGKYGGFGTSGASKPVIGGYSGYVKNSSFDSAPTYSGAGAVGFGSR